MEKSISISELCDEVCKKMPFSKKLVNYYLLHMKEFFFEENLSWPVDVIPVTKLKLERIEMDIIKFIEKQICLEKVTNQIIIKIKNKRK